MYQDDPEVKCALIKAATKIVIAEENGASMNQETADAANSYLQYCFELYDDAEETPQDEA